MTGRWQDRQVRIRRLRSGAIRIGPYSTFPAGLARVNLPGATMLVDPMTPHCPPTLEVSDAAEAAELVSALFGASVSENILGLDRYLDTAPVAEPAGVLSPRLQDLQTLGHLIWLAQTAPWPLPSAVLVGELINAMDVCLDLLEDPETVRQAMTNETAPMQSALAAAMAGRLPLPVITLLRAACGSVARALPLTDPRQSQLSEMLEMASSPATHESPTGPNQVLVEACTPAAATHAGAVDGTLYTGSTTAEWSRNLAGLISRNENTVTWTVEARGLAEAELTVVAGKAGPEPRVGPVELPVTTADGLLRALTTERSNGRSAACSVHTPAWPLPLTEFLLTTYPGTGDLVGHGRVLGPVAQALRAAIETGNLVVDVHDIGHRYTHLGPVSLSVEAARRWSARAVCASRIVMARPGASTQTTAAANSAWHRALALWRHTEVTENPDLARERIRHCAAWLNTIRRTGEEPAPSAPDLADPLGPDDLSSPGWTVTLAELLSAGGATTDG